MLKPSTNAFPKLIQRVLVYYIPIVLHIFMHSPALFHHLRKSHTTAVFHRYKTSFRLSPTFSERRWFALSTIFILFYSFSATIKAYTFSGSAYLSVSKSACRTLQRCAWYISGIDYFNWLNSTFLPRYSTSTPSTRRSFKNGHLYDFTHVCSLVIACEGFRTVFENGWQCMPFTVLSPHNEILCPVFKLQPKIDLLPHTLS